MTHSPLCMSTWRVYARRLVVPLVLMWATAPYVMGQTTKAEPLRVYLFTTEQEGGFEDMDSKQRADSLKDLREALRKKKSVVLVDERDRAELFVEVLRRGLEDTGKTSTKTTGGLGGLNSNTTKDTEAIVRTRLSIGEYSTEIIGKNDGRITNVWRTAANNAANQIDKWIQANHDRVRQYRPKQL